VTSEKGRYGPSPGSVGYDAAAAYVRLILQGLGISPGIVLAGTGISVEGLDELEFVPWQSLAVIFDNLDAHAGSVVWPVELGARLNITSHGAVGFAALTAPTAGDAVATIATYYRARITAVEMNLREENNVLRLTIGDVTGDPAFAGRIALIVMKVVESLLAAILGKIPDRALNVCLAMPAGAKARRIAGMYQARVTFGADSYSIAMPAGWRMLPSPLHERSAYRENILECQRAIGRSNTFPTTAGMVRAVLRAHLEAGLTGGNVPARPPALEEMAGRMAVTPRTLMRRLQREGDSYQQILDLLRQEYAARMLADARLDIADIAMRLGYTESPNFCRAFRRWYGASPAAWRRTMN